MEWMTYIFDFAVMIWNLHWSVPLILIFCIGWPLANWSLQRNPSVIANGFMSIDKGKELAPEVFGNPDKDEPDPNDRE